MECFIKKIFTERIDGSVHRQFIRFSRGTFSGRAALNLVKKDNIKLGGSFEFANDFVYFAAENSEAKFSGKILSREKLDFNGKEKSSIYEYDVIDISSGKILEVRDKAYSLLLDAEAPGMKLTMKKKKLPKPGKSGNLKIDDKFCILECDLKFWDKLKEFFMIPECSKAKISHTIIVDDVMADRNEKDFAKMRENARKKGRIIRSMQVDGRETQEEREFIA